MEARDIEKEEKGRATNVVKLDTSLPSVQTKDAMEVKYDPNKKKEKGKGRYTKKKYGQVHIGEEWVSDDELSSDEEGVATITI